MALSENVIDGLWHTLISRSDRLNGCSSLSSLSIRGTVSMNTILTETVLIVRTWYYVANGEVRDQLQCPVA